MLNFNNIQIKNGIYDNLNITKDVTTAYSNEIPSWDVNTIFNAEFNGNLGAGNINFTIAQLDSILIKRRKVGNSDWLTIYSISVEESSDLSFSVLDRYCGYGEYEYAILPSLNGTEGEYNVKTVDSKFEGVYLCDASNSFKFFGNCRYDGVEQVENVGVFEPYGSKYPIIVTNSKIDYKRLSINGLLLSNTFYTNRVLTPTADRLLLDNLMEVLAERKPKIIKDQSGHLYMVSSIGNKGITFVENKGMTVASVNLPFAEIGDAESETDLLANGFITTS